MHGLGNDYLYFFGEVPDDVVEAIEMPGERYVMGIQWHPEGLVNCPDHQNIFKELIAHAIAYSEKKSK